MYIYSEIKQDISIISHLKWRDSISLRCLYCGNEFTRQKRDLISAIRLKVENSFCSQECNGKAKSEKNTIITKCDMCGKEFVKVVSKLTEKNFCNHSCAASYNNTHGHRARPGTRVSKLEKFLQERLPVLFPNLEIHYNRKDAINSELDIYIPSFKLAIELNGIFHYEPIYGPNKLLQIQNNDNRKIQACIERGIEFCIIDISKITYLKESTALPILKIIEDLINMKLG